METTVTTFMFMFGGNRILIANPNIIENQIDSFELEIAIQAKQGITRFVSERISLRVGVSVQEFINDFYRIDNGRGRFFVQVVKEATIQVEDQGKIENTGDFTGQIPYMIVLLNPTGSFEDSRLDVIQIH